MPPPSAKPLTAAIVGLPRFSTAPRLACSRRGQLLGPPRRQQAGKFLDVETGAKRSLTVAGDDGHLHFRVVGQPRKARRQFLHHLRVQHVQRRVGQRNDGERAFLVQANQLPIGSHVGLLCGQCQVV